MKTNISVNSTLLRGHLDQKKRKISAEINIHVDTLRKKLSKPQDWRLKDLNKLCNALDIDVADIIIFEKSKEEGALDRNEGNT